ncbi:MAG: septum formation initiator family protein, partial [Actinobacteria bacterium]|nr:septum formation initiator family protein [Actinomycetota bacterium]
SGPKRRKVPVLQRLSRVSARTVILVILMIFFIAFAVGPVSRNLEATLRLKKKEVELEKQRAATESLEKEMQEARSLDYVEREARRQRMVAPGEVLYLVTPEESELEVEYRVKNLQSMDEAWERVRRMLKCTPPGSEAGE